MVNSVGQIPWIILRNPAHFTEYVKQCSKRPCMELCNSMAHPDLKINEFLKYTEHIRSRVSVVTTGHPLF